MSLIIADRVKETTITSGTGTITLSGRTFGGFQTFSGAIGDGNTTYYCIQNEDQFEIGIGTYTAGTNTLSRDTIFQSSNSDNKISSNGVGIVFSVVPADRLIYKDENNSVVFPTPFAFKRTDNGDYWQALSTDFTNRVASFFINEGTDPTWKIGLKTSQSETVAPYYAYVSAKDGFIELRGNSSSILSIGDGASEGLQVNHQLKNIIDIRKNGGEIAIQNLDLNSDETTTAKNSSIGYTVFAVESSVGHISDLQTWSVSTDEKASINQYGDFETVGNVIAPSGRFDVIRFSDGTTQETAASGIGGESYDDTAISGYFESRVDSNETQITAVSGWAKSYVDSQDHSAVAVSGWARDYVDSQDHSAAAVSGYLEPLVNSNQQDISTVSGLLTPSGESFDFVGNVLTYNNSDGGSFTADLSSLSTFDTSGVSLSYSDGTLTYTNNAGGSFDVDISSISGDVYAMIVDGAPSTLDTLNEIAAALNDDSNIATTLTNLINTTSGNLQTQITDNDNDISQLNVDISTVSGLLYDDSYVSGVAVYASGHTLQSITDNGAATDNAITINNNLTAENLFGDLYGPIVFECKNNTGSQINAGTPVYVSGYYSNNGKSLIAPAIGNDATKMPAVGILANNLADESEGHVHVFGEVPRLDTSSFSVGDTVYVDPTGGLTNTRPTGVEELVQNIGRVLRSDASQGKILLLGPGRTNDVPNSGTFSELSVGGSDIISQITAVSGWAESYVDSQDHSAASVSGALQSQITQYAQDVVTVSGLLGSSSSVSGIVFEKSGSNDEYRIGTIFVDPDGTEQVVRATDFNGGYLRLEVARFSPSVSAAGQSRSWDQPVSQWTVTVDNPTDFTTNYVSGVKSPLTGITGSVTSDVTLYSTTGPSVTPGGGVDWTQTFTTDGDSPIYSSASGLTGGSASATVSFLDKNQATISETATISFSWSNASSSISFNSLTGNNFLQLYSSVGYNLTITGLSNSSNASTTITTSQGTLSNSSNDGTMTLTTPIHKNNNSGRTITATTDFTRPATVTGTEYTTQRVVSDSSISASFTYPSFRIFTSSTSNPPSRADIVDTNDFDSSVVTELGNQVKTLSQTINNPESLAQCMWFAVRSSASQPTSFQTGSSSSLLSDVTPTETTVSLEPDSPAAGYVAEGYNLYGITLQPGNTYVSIS